MPFSSSILEEKLRKVDQELALPSRTPLIQATHDSTGWASHYGGLQELVSYSKLLRGLPARFNATWQHGVFEEYRYRRHPELLLYGVNHVPDRLILVATEHQASCLNEAGYTNVHAVGLPFVYAKPNTLPERRAGSVLAMPVHSLDGAPFENEELIDAYAAWLSEKHKDAIDTLFVCIHMSCIRNNQWWPSMLRKGLKIVAGADHGDGNSYQRIWALFAQFDTVTTNNIGSHIYYALAAGCKVVIEGPDIPFSREQIMRDNTYQRMVQAGMSIDLDAEGDHEMRLLRSAFSMPRESKDIGNSALGTCYKKNPSEIRGLLKWSKRSQIYCASMVLGRLWKTRAIRAKIPL